ncbi:MAG: sigma-54-dependent Fis family transcriptional regulator, partial [Myxococcales bacterium]|nr:sigma-54-dependent Fis family transcriptional regulator [Myxococcales bacterium]
LRAQLAAIEAARALAAAGGGAAGAAAPASSEDKKPSELTPDEVEQALVANDYKLGPAAVALGISRPALNELVDSHPTLVRANNLGKDEIQAALDAAGGDLDQAWRALKVSKRGLKLRMSSLDMLAAGAGSDD